MKRLVCEMCGGTDLVKDEGVFVCQSCGCKYSVEEAKKMMVEVEGTVDVSGSTVKVDNSGLIDSYLQMAENALEAENFSEAENYANKIIEIEANHYKAWFIKGKAAGWQTTGRNNRYSESIVNWINAYMFVPEENKEDLTEQIKSEVMTISVAFLQMECNSFANYRSEENKEDVVKAVTLIEKQLSMLKEKTGIDGFEDYFKDILAKHMNDSIVEAFNAANESFGTERRQKNQYSWEHYTAECDRCCILFELAYALADNANLCHTISSNYVYVAELVRDSQSYKFQPSSTGGSYIPDYSFTSEAKRIRNEQIDKWKIRKDFHDPEMRKKGFEESQLKCKEIIENIEKEKASKKYWEENADEKNKLEKEKESLKEQINCAKAEKEASSLYEKQKDSESRIASLTREMNALGVFKGKEKKALKEKIDSEQEEVKQINSSIVELEEKYAGIIDPLQKRLDEIEAELTKERGRSPIEHDSRPELFIANRDELAISPVGLLEYIKKKLPAPYRLDTGTEADIINNTKMLHDLKQLSSRFSNLTAALEGKTLNNNASDNGEWKDDPNEAKTYRIDIYKNDDMAETAIYCDAKSEHQPIIKNIRFCLSMGFGIKEATDFITIVSLLIYDLFPSEDLFDIQNSLAGGVYGFGDTKTIVSEGIKLEFQRMHKVYVIVSLP